MKVGDEVTGETILNSFRKATVNDNNVVFYG